MKLTEKQLKTIIKESITNYLKEGTDFPDAIYKWNHIKEEIGADAMLDYIFRWSSSDYIDKLIQWFEDDEVVTFEK